MRYRLDAQHYISDRLLEPGHIIGDDTDVAFRNPDGSPMMPSVSMTPLDGEAQNHFKQKFPGAKLPPRDATEAIPIRINQDTGQVQQPNHQGPVSTGGPGEWVLDADGNPTNERKDGLPNSGSPNSPVGRPVIGTVPQPGTTPQVPPKPEDPSLRVNAPPAEQKAVADAQAKAQADAAAKADGLPNSGQGKK